MTSVLFVAGQLGLALVAVCCVAIIHITTQVQPRKAWYYHLMVWAVALLCAFKFGDDAQAGQASPPTLVVSILQIVLGLERLAVYLSYRLANSLHIPDPIVARINGYVAVTTGVGLVGVLVWVLIFARPASIEQELASIKREVRTNRSVSAADTARTVELQRTIDVLTARAKQDSVDKARLHVQIARMNVRLEELTDLLIQQGRALRKLGVSVERSRSSAFYPAPLTPKSSTPITLPTDRVKPLAPPKKRGWFGFTYDDADTLYMARHDY